MTKSYTKTKAQMKSSSYYLFWGIATVAVVAGQVYVGTGYRTMAKSMNRWFEETIDIITMPRRNNGGIEFLNRSTGRPAEIDPDDYIIWETVD
tara:strand:+ start:2971 stop:3249 length:279 start_codon:yes stop_codon:yes gene_type:complete